MNKIINIYTDGGARGNPGPAAIGVYIEDENGSEIAGFGERIGHATNNTAEYKAVIKALEWIENYVEKDKVIKANFYMDSNLVCSQINGLFKVKNSDMRNHLLRVRVIEASLNLPIYYSHVPREKNKKADSYVNSALDSKE